MFHVDVTVGVTETTPTAGDTVMKATDNSSIVAGAVTATCDPLFVCAPLALDCTLKKHPMLRQLGEPVVWTSIEAALKYFNVIPLGDQDTRVVGNKRKTIE